MFKIALSRYYGSRAKKKMSKKRTQLNIKIDPKLLLKLKSEAIKDGKTLTEFVTQKLSSIPSNSRDDSLEQRLTKIEQHLNLDKNSSEEEKSIGSIFTDQGAKKYGEVAKALFDLHRKKKRLSLEDSLKELDIHLKKLPHSSPELVFQILLGAHDLTGLEMTNAYRYGSCAMRTALSQWSKDSLEELNDAFLNAVITKSLA